MGFWLRDRIKSWSSVTSSDTQRLELPNSGIISAIELRVNNVRDATVRTATTVVQHLAEALTKIEIIETGQKIIKSLDGTVLLAHNLRDFKTPVYNQYREDAGQHNTQYFYLLFGRYIMDREYGLDLGRHKDVRLEIQHAFSETASIGWDDDSGDIEVYIWRWIGTDLAPRGYFKTSEKYHYTASGTAGEVRKELPCLNPYRRIMIRTFLTSKTIGACITELSLIANDGAYKPFYGLAGSKMSAHDQAVHGLVEFFGGRTLGYTGSVSPLTESFISYPEEALCHPMNASNAHRMAITGWSGGRLIVTKEGTGNLLGQLIVRGKGYQYVSSIPFDIPDDESAYFETKELDKLEVVLNHGAHACDTRIVVDELIKY